MIDPVTFASSLIACPSITPACGQVFDLLEEALLPLGFDVHRFVLGEEPDGPTENMVAIRGVGSPHFGFAGHLDVVPPGDGWSSDPFEAVIENGRLFGRGANDMIVPSGARRRPEPWISTKKRSIGSAAQASSSPLLASTPSSISARV